MRRARLLLLAAAPLALQGCVVRTAANVATAPVRAVGWTADRLTTSQAEADRNRGRRDRKEEEQKRKQQQRQEKAARKAAEEQVRQQAPGS